MQETQASIARLVEAVERIQVQDYNRTHCSEDEGVSLILRRLTYSQADIFKTRCIANHRVWAVIIDSGCSENMVSIITVDKLQLKTKKHFAPYKIGWLNDNHEEKVTEQFQIPF